MREGKTTLFPSRGVKSHGWTFYDPIIIKGGIIMDSRRIYDVTIPIKEGMVVWPSDDPVR